MDRFWSKVDKTGDCWEWTASKGTSGYGQFCLAGNRPLGAHRVSYALTHGEIPAGNHVLHKCDNKLCVNPDHLFLGTHAENMADMTKKGRRVKGEKHGLAKLCELDVWLIREIDLPHRIIADWFNVDRAHIGQIKCRGRWGHV